MREIELTTDRKTQLLNITDQVRAAVQGNGDASAALVYVPHTTAGVTISTAWAESTGALVNVLLEGPPYAAQAPTLTISPATVQWATPASPVNYTVTVRNNDSSSCDAAAFGLSAAVPAGWSGAFGSASVSLAPGATASLGLTVAMATPGLTWPTVPPPATTTHVRGRWAARSPAAGPSDAR